MDAHKAARDALRGAAAESGQSASGRGGEVLLMVDYYSSKAAELRSNNELQPGGTLNHSIPFRPWCAYTLFQGEPAKLCLCSNLLFPSMLNPSLGGQLL